MERPRAPSLVSVNSKQLFWNEWRRRCDSTRAASAVTAERIHCVFTRASQFINPVIGDGIVCGEEVTVRNRWPSALTS
jgi:hypothetical protein